MIIYNPHNELMITARIKIAEDILEGIPAKHCFITGSFLHREKYNDIDIFIITRSKKKICIAERKANAIIIDFNDLHSLFHHSITKSCVAKDILPTKPLKVTMSDYWDVINEAVPTLLNQKKKYHKDVRFLIIYTEYFKTGSILDTFELSQRIAQFGNYKEILEYVNREIPEIFQKRMEKSYLDRFFYTKAGFLKDVLEYPAQRFLYDLCHVVTHG